MTLWCSAKTISWPIFCTITQEQKWRLWPYLIFSHILNQWYMRNLTYSISQTLSSLLFLILISILAFRWLLLDHVTKCFSLELFTVMIQYTVLSHPFHSKPDSIPAIDYIHCMSLVDAGIWLLFTLLSCSLPNSCLSFLLRSTADSIPPLSSFFPSHSPLVYLAVLVFLVQLGFL